MSYHDSGILSCAIVAMIALSCDPSSSPTEGPTEPPGADEPKVQPTSSPKAAPHSAPSSQPKTEPESVPSSHPNYDVVFGSPFDLPHTEKIKLNRRTGGTMTAREECASEIGVDTDVPTGEIDYKRSVVYVKTGQVVTAKNAGQISVAPYSKLDTPEPAIDIQYPEGARLEVVKGIGGGKCVVKIEAMRGVANCPTTTNFSAKNWNGSVVPESYLWCVQLDQGWIRVDDSIDVINKETF